MENVLGPCLILALCFGFVLAIIALGQRYSLRKRAIKAGLNPEDYISGYKSPVSRKEREEKAKSREELLADIARLNKRIENMEIILKDRK